MRRSVGSEILRMGTVLAVPAAVALVLPYRAFTFRAAEPKADAPAFVAFVTLDAAQERAALKVAKSSLRDESSRIRHLQADLSFGELPEERGRPVLPLPERAVAPPMPCVAFGVPVFRPAQAAEPPRTIPRSAPAKPKPAFPREELLKIE